MVGHDGDRIVQADDLAHALDRPRLAVVEAGHLAAEHRTRGDGRDLHPRQPHVDAILRGPVHLRRCVEPLRGRSNQPEVLRLLEGDLRGHRQFGRLVGQRAVGERTAGRRVGHHSPLRPARRRVHVPRRCCGGHEHGARRRPGAAQRLVEHPHGSRGARFLIAEERIGVELVVGRSVLEPDLVQSDLELFRQQHGHRGVRALTHFDLRHDERDPAVGADANERVRRENRRSRLRGCCDGARLRVDMPPQQQSTAGGGTRGQELPTGHAGHGQPPLLTVDGVCAACLMASRIRG